MLIDTRIFRAIVPSEDRWLPQCFVKSSIYASLINESSTLVSVERGCGKSTLILQAQQELRGQWLCVNFQPHALPDDSGTPLDSLLRDITRQLWATLEAKPDVVATIGSRVRPLRYFLNRYMGADLVTYYVERLLEDHPTHAEAIARLNIAVPADLFAVASESEQVAVLCDCAQKLGFKGVMVWTEIRADEQEEQVASSDYIFDSLFLLRKPYIHFKCLAPLEICTQFGNRRGPETLSVDQLNLTWDAKSLMALLDRRLAIATEGKFTSLGQVVDAECFRAFAEDELHLSTPRDWLNLAQMVGEQVAATPQVATSHAPLSEEAWSQVRRAYFAAHIPIYFDKVKGVFVRGEREVLSQKQRALFKLLKHFYDNPGFHKIYKVESALDISTTNLHTYINRIREVIEPSPNHEPVYLVFDHKQQAYALQHAVHTNI